eukprot:TRINITY_DN46032_c0_g1_i1.p1 TRINITY_DN46032_c0_g1~~TRINITY_DN46032_c0_g1_i1.p1  ORF type:complete len:458 (+),score=100.10 TRINITY_DN46032_c0_g1_i1:228-1601(+)
MPPVHTAYYERLNLEPTATAQEIKSAYRKQALKLHPDKGGDPEAFRQMKAAYDVLSDPSKRQMYDDYGPEVVNMMDGNVSSPDAVIIALSQAGKRVRCTVVFIVLVFAISLLSPTILVSLKWDNKANWSWSVPFYPLWIAQGLGLFFLICCIQVPPLDENEEELEEEVRQVHQEQRRAVRVMKCCSTVTLMLLMTSEVVLSWRLQGTITWPWMLVLLPWVICELFLLCWRCSSVANAYVASDPAAAAASAAANGGHIHIPLSFCISYVSWGILRICTLILGAAKADGHLQMSWYMTTLPLILGGVGHVAAACSRPTRRPRPPGGDGAAAEEEEEKNEGCNVCCNVSCWLFMAVMFAGKLDGQQYSAFLVFMPIFLLVGLITCVISCVVITFNTEMAAAGVAAQSRDQAAQQERENLASAGSAGASGYSTFSDAAPAGSAEGTGPPSTSGAAPVFSGP